MTINGDHLSTDHDTRFVVSGKRIIVYERAVDKKAEARGELDFCWKRVAVYHRRGIK